MWNFRENWRRNGRKNQCRQLVVRRDCLQRGEINEAQGRLLTTNRIYNDGSGTVDIGKAMEGFLTFLPPQMKVEKPVVHISLNPHPEDVLTDIELQNIARDYLEKLGFGNQPILFSSTRI